LTGYTDNGDGSTFGLPAGSYFYKLSAEDVNGNSSAAGGASGAATVSADTSLPKVTCSPLRTAR
jgi:hypothetical protein